MDDLSIQNLSETAVLLEQARKDTIKKYSAYQKARELQESIRFQMQAELERYAQSIINKEEE